jgi:hypothetical protein
MPQLGGLSHTKLFTVLEKRSLKPRCHRAGLNSWLLGEPITFSCNQWLKVSLVCSHIVPVSAFTRPLPCEASKPPSPFMDNVIASRAHREIQDDGDGIHRCQRSSLGNRVHTQSHCNPSVLLRALQRQKMAWEQAGSPLLLRASPLHTFLCTQAWQESLVL